MTQPPAHATAPQPAMPSRRSGRWWLRVAVGGPILVLLWYFVGTRLLESFRGIHWSSLRINAWAMAGAVVVMMVVRVIQGLNAALLLAAVGSPMPVRRVMPVIWIATLGRYVPLQYAAVAGALYGLVRIGARLPAAMAALFLATSLMMFAGLVASMPLLFMPVIADKAPSLWIVALVFMAAALFCLHPRVFPRICNPVLVRLKRPPLPDALRPGPFFSAVAMAALRAVLLGLAMWFTLRSVTHVAAVDYLLVLCSAGLAVVAGFLVFFAPAAIGVHEGVYLLTLTPLVGAESAALAAVLFRLLHLVGDSAVGAAGMLMLRSASAPPGTC